MRISNVKVPVVILRCEHYGALGIARSLGRLGIPVFGVDGNLRNPTFTSRYCRKGFIWDVTREKPKATLDFLMSISRSFDAMPVLIPTSDETSLFVATYQQTLSHAYRFPGVPPGLVAALCNKIEMHRMMASLGYPTARTVLPQSSDELQQVVGQMTFPVMLKGNDGAKLERALGAKMLVVPSRQEFMALYRRLPPSDRSNVMVQEYIPGGDDSVWMFNGYFDNTSRCRVVFTGRKLRQNPAYTGMTSLGIAETNAVISGRTRSIMRAIGYRGILDIGYRFDRRDGLYKVLDINPRIGATFRLFLGENGGDVVRALYCDMTGQPIPVSRQAVGRKWFVEDTDLKSSLRYIRDGVLGIAEWSRSYRGVQEAGYFASDDMRPFFLRVLYHVFKLLRRALRITTQSEAGLGEPLTISRDLRPDPTTTSQRQGALDRATMV